MVKVKICGITNLIDAQAAIACGCDALGFAFYKKSPRYIRPEDAQQIISKLPKNLIKIGVFVNAREETIKHTAKTCHLDILQFHGHESPEFCAKFKGYKIIKAIRVKDKLDIASVQKYDPFAFLFDTYVESKAGGTGKKFNWELIRHLSDIKRPVFLSGGLTQRNVAKAIATTHPDWVDVSSGVESLPGKKDHQKIKRFIDSAKKA